MSGREAEKLRILVLAPFAPDPNAAHGGGRVIGQMVRHLANRHQASRHRVALCFLRAPGEPPLPPDLRAACEIVEEVLLPEPNTSRLAGIKDWARMLAGKPLWAIGRYSREFETRLRALIQDWQPDIVHIEYHIMGQYLSACGSYPAPRVLVQHEPGFEAARAEGTRGRLIPALDRLAWRRFEPAVMRQVQAVVVFTERDRQALMQIVPEARILRIPFGIEIPTQAQPPLDTSFDLLFTGNFIHPPNADAALRLIERIFPAVRERFPQARLTIVGANPPAEILRGAGDGFIVTGQVPDVTPFLERAALVMAPLRLGGGMRVKVLEALAAGKAVIASPLAAEGLDVSSGKQLILAERDEEFTQAAIRLLADPAQRAEIARCARDWAAAHLSWDTTIAAYERLYHSLLAEREARKDRA